jgi:competence protein ComEC
MAGGGAGVTITREGLRIWHGAGRRALAEAASACATHDLVILSEPAAEADPPVIGAYPRRDRRQAADGSGARRGGCPIIDAADLLSRTGALAIDLEGGAFAIRTARAAQGDRRWTR